MHDANITYVQQQPMGKALFPGGLDQLVSVEGPPVWEWRDKGTGAAHSTGLSAAPVCHRDGTETPSSTARQRRALVFQLMKDVRLSFPKLLRIRHLVMS